ncbi:vesicular-fusion ATPase-like protein, putative [Leishmania tarentolae]|uniref:Vesicular-fusion ATPase-like protein, putative n=1 Tax=Leishmania tarentolae TaxID=5689 RepID=A0A640KL45_LEITA|nr:vesicular-fusion ATPase-like protein, putative [Leishmania tarentolae]
MCWSCLPSRSSCCWFAWCAFLSHTMRQALYRLGQCAQRSFSIFVFSMIFLSCVYVLARAQEYDTAPEILYVRGCRDSPAEARETTGCFAASTGAPVSSSISPVPIASVRLSLQGVNLPSDVRDTDNDDSQAVLHRVLLQEHRRLPLLRQEQNDSGTRLLEKIVLTCNRPMASPVFPTQLISCELENPLLTLTGVAGMAPQLARLVSQPMWFDIRLEERRSGEEAFRTISVLRRAVELRVSNTTDAEDETAAEKLRDQLGKVSWKEVREHPLERLYAPFPASKDRGKGSGEPRSGSKDSYDSDPAVDDDDMWVEIGVGGLQRELRTLFRRVFLSRLPSLAPLAEALQLQHVRGVILYGPPGNGKTLIARNLFRLLGPNTRISLVNAADILSKFVGESEKNLRDVFEGYDIGTTSKEETAQQENQWFDRAAHRRKDPPKKGALTVLVIDEFEALFRRRGHSSDEGSAKAVYDGVTNTLLSLMDGVKSRNDLLVVGLTNRLQAIDSALLRPGRFEVLIEIPAPDVPGREDIFFIHTERLREGNFLAADVVLRDLALQSGGFSGSDIAGTVRSALSYALLRYRQHGLFQVDSQSMETDEGPSSVSDEEMIGHRAGDVGGFGLESAGGNDNAGSCASSNASFKVTLEDFERAFKDIRSAKDEASVLSQISAEGDRASSEIVDYDGTVSKNIDRATAVIERVMQSNRTVTGMLAITGAPGTGKSTVARALTSAYDFTTVRYLSCRRLAQLPNHEEQLVKLREALNDASHTESGIVVLDDYDVLVEVMGGGDYTGNVLRSLLYEYMHRPGGVSRALAANSQLTATDGAGDNAAMNAESRVSADRNHRILVLTSSLSSVLQQLSFDVHLRVHPVLRRGAAALLQEYRVADPLQSAKVAAAYPVSMSYRTFLRITDVSLQRWVQEVENTKSVTGDLQSSGVESSELRRKLPAYFATSDQMRTAYNEMRARQVAENFYAVDDSAASRSFVSAVRTTVADMGLIDPYQGWGGEDSDEEDGKETVTDVDEIVGAADELLW